MTVLSIIWILVGLLYVYVGITLEPAALLMASFILVPSLLLWVGSYRAANFFILCLIASVLVSAGKLCLSFLDVGVMAFKSKATAKLLLALVCIPPLWKWSDKHNPAAQKD